MEQKGAASIEVHKNQGESGSHSDVGWQQMCADALAEPMIPSPRTFELLSGRIAAVQFRGGKSANSPPTVSELINCKEQVVLHAKVVMAIWGKRAVISVVHVAQSRAVHLKLWLLR